jgi:hypothetical protein
MIIGKFLDILAKKLNLLFELHPKLCRYKVGLLKKSCCSKNLPESVLKQRINFLILTLQDIEAKQLFEEIVK